MQTLVGAVPCCEKIISSILAITCPGSFGVFAFDLNPGPKQAAQDFKDKLQLSRSGITTYAVFEVSGKSFHE